MTNPLASAGSSSPSVVNVGSGVPDNLGLLIQVLLSTRARKQRQAELAFGAIEPGTKFKDLDPEAQKQAEKATGRKYGPDEVVHALPVGQDVLDVERQIRALNLPDTSSLAMGLRAGLAARLATGRTGLPATPEQLSSEQAGAAEAVGRARELGATEQPGKMAEARARASEAASFEAAVAKTKAGIPLAEDEVAAYQHFNNFVPSQAIADQLGGEARAEVMKQSLRLAADPNSATFAKLLAPFGISAADAIGAVGLGIGSMIQTAMGLQASLQASFAESKGKAEEIAYRALMQAAEEISKRLGGAYDPIFISQVMRGDPKALATPAGQMIQRFTSAGYRTALTDMATKGDPAMIALRGLQEIARIPQIASDDKLLSKYSNLYQYGAASALTRYYTGQERPAQPGPEQDKWDAVAEATYQSMAGVFKEPGFFKGLLPGKQLDITPMGRPLQNKQERERMEALPDASRQKMEDIQILDQTLRALLDSLGPQAGGKK